MSEARGVPPDDPAEDQLRHRNRNATAHFFDLKLSHWVQIGLTVALLVVAGVQASIYWFQAGIMSDQTTISRNQLLLSEVVERPWIDILGLAPLSDLTLKNGLGFFNVRIVMKNTGNMPAFNSFAFSKPYLRQNAGTAQGDLKNFCLESKKFKPFGDGEGDAIFPNSSMGAERGFDFSDADIPPSGKTAHTIIVFAMACVTYRVPEQSKIHTTGKLFLTMRRDGTNTLAVVFSHAELNVPQTTLYFVPSATYAD